MTLTAFYRIRWFTIPIIIILCVLHEYNFDKIAIIILVTLGGIGAILGIFVQFYHLPCKCDLCSSKARLIAKYQDPIGSRIMINCDNCGLVVNASRFGIRIERYNSDA